MTIAFDDQRLRARLTGRPSEGATAALEAIRIGVLTGEGPTVRGRVHFSRTIDAKDAAACEAALIDAGPAAVTRAEIEAMFAIDAAGTERLDSGHFDRLLARALAHHLALLAGSGAPARGEALSGPSPIAEWLRPTQDLPLEAKRWLARRLRERSSSSADFAQISAIMLGEGEAARLPSLRAVVDLAA